MGRTYDANHDAICMKNLALRLSFRLGPKSQPHVTAVDRSAARYTCYAQRNGLDSRSSITCHLSLGAGGRGWLRGQNRLGGLATDAKSVWTSQVQPTMDFGSGCAGLRKMPASGVRRVRRSDFARLG
jgi:hypothetical protein